MVRYTVEEKLDMYNVYVKSLSNSVEASRIYSERYPERRQPHRTVFERICRNLVQSSSINKTRGKYSVNASVNEINVLAQIHINPENSSRNIAREVGITDRGVRKVLKKYKFHDYKFKPVQTLYPVDYQRRLRFCEWFRQEQNNDPLIARKIIWSDESIFTNQGIYNRKNKHYYATNNPHLYQEVRPQIRYSLNMWCGIFDNMVIGPFFIPGNLNAETYLNILQVNLEDFLDSLPLAQLRNLKYFQHDGARPHTARIVQRYLNNRFPNAWIGNNGPVEWPTRSPCLNPLDYFLWGYTKNKVYYRPTDNILELRERTTDCINSINPDIVRAAVDDMAWRITACIRQNGGHFQHLEN